MSNAIKVMLNDYLRGSDVGEDEPHLGGDCRDPGVSDAGGISPAVGEKEEALAVELDRLRSRLTESECAVSRKGEENARFVSEIFALKSEVVNLKDSERKLKAELAIRANASEDSKFQAEKIHSQEESLQSLQSLLTQSQKECSSLKAMVEAMRPSGSDEEVSGLRAQIDSLTSQVQTLEVQKSDAEAEITKLRNALAGQAFIAPIPKAISEVSSRRFSRRPTVSVHGMSESLSERPSLLGDSFVNASSSKRRSVKKTDSQQCVQQ